MLMRPTGVDEPHIHPETPMMLDLGEVSLEYEVLGDGPQVVWLHGLTGSLDESRPLCRWLAREHRVLSYSARGHGRSSAVHTRAQCSYDLIAEDLARIMDAVGFERPIIAGGSHGANSALRHQWHHPGRARGLLLVAPGANALRRPKRPQWWLVRGHSELAFRRGPDAVVRAITGEDPSDPGHDEQKVAAARTHDLASLRRVMKWVPDQQVTPAAALTEMRVPTLVTAWDHDPLIHPIAVARRIAELIPGAEFVEMPKATTLSAQEAGELLAQRLARVSELAL